MSEYERRSRWTPWHVLAIVLIVGFVAGSLMLISRLTDSGPSRSEASAVAAAPSTAASANGMTPPHATEAPPSATEAPVVVPTAPPGGSAAPQFARDSLVEVVTDDLRVRSKPGVSDDSIKLEPLLWTGAWAWVVDGPVTASGYQWYLLQPLPEVDVQVNPDPPAVGWVAAAGKDGEQWLAQARIECLSSPLGWLQYEWDYPPQDKTALACFGGSTLQFTALLGTQSVLCGDQAWRTTPVWLDECHLRYTLADPDSDASFETGVLPVAVDPGLETGNLPTVGSGEPLLVDIAGQYDHPSAGTCVAERVNPSSEPAPDPRLVIRDCRATFVITGIDVGPGLEDHYRVMDD